MKIDVCGDAVAIARTTHSCASDAVRLPYARLPFASVYWRRRKRDTLISSFHRADLSQKKSVNRIRVACGIRAANRGKPGHHRRKTSRNLAPRFVRRINSFSRSLVPFHWQAFSKLLSTDD